jgi:hypothetical protein
VQNGYVNSAYVMRAVDRRESFLETDLMSRDGRALGTTGDSLVEMRTVPATAGWRIVHVFYFERPEPDIQEVPLIAWEVFPGSGEGGVGAVGLDECGITFGPQQKGEFFNYLRDPEGTYWIVDPGATPVRAQPADLLAHCAELRKGLGL